MLILDAFPYEVGDMRFAFQGAERGAWRVMSATTLCGEPLPPASHIDIVSLESTPARAGAAWTVEGVKSNVRYATRGEMAHLRSKQEGLGRPVAIYAALIPIRKTTAWWDMAQDERRAIFEEVSHHNAIGVEYLPAIARQLYHCRDFAQPFDFLTWFEFSPEHSAAFDKLLARLRAAREWTYVDREIDIRLERVAV